MKIGVPCKVALSLSAVCAMLVFTSAASAQGLECVLAIAGENPGDPPTHVTAPGCDSFEQEKVIVPPGERVTRIFICPGDTPHFWNWHVEHSTNVFVTLVRAVKDSIGNVTELPVRPDTGAHIELLNPDPKKSGEATVHLGCSSTEPFPHFSISDDTGLIQGVGRMTGSGPNRFPKHRGR